MKAINIPGYSSNPTADDALAIALFGEQGAGKTRFMCTAPDPIGIVPLDRKSRKTIKKWADILGKQVVMPDIDFIRVANPMALATMNEQDAKKYYRKHVNAVKDAAYTLYKHKDIRTVCIDTGSQLWEDVLFAEFGRSQRIMPRDRGSVNQEMIDLYNALSGKHLIVTHKAKDIWKNDQNTGRQELVGFSHTGYHMNVIVELQCDEKKRAEDEERFKANVVLCQDNPDIQGPNGKKLLVDEYINFQMLAMSIYPDSDPADWE